ncbi:hypothetical protein CMV16_12115 [Peribacillus simplex]|nr:hypothetical protein CMV16_12115 [Peribacillus simplex]
MERVHKTPAGKACPRGTRRRKPRADHPRKASAWSGNQRSHCKSHKKTVVKLDFQEFDYCPKLAQKSGPV